MKPRPLMILTFTSLMAVAAMTAPAWGGTVYRWVDDEGNVQFGENPPPGSDARDTGHRTRNPDRETASPQDNREPQAPRPGPEKTDSQEKPVLKERPLTPEQKEELARQHKANCEAARSALETMDNYARLQIEENGERRYLTPEEIQERRQRLEGIREESCNWSPDD
ncbi:MAG: DUF4124 domain-containing protein [Oleiphilaceae bacterium]|nr:DUF4124 domain-containing protein [Oleiphilaceae bacterium]